MLSTDKTIWTVLADAPNRCYRVASEANIIADNLTLAHATQIVDEHRIVRRIVDTLAEREATPITVTRAPL